MTCAIGHGKSAGDAKWIKAVNIATGWQHRWIAQHVARRVRVSCTGRSKARRMAGSSCSSQSKRLMRARSCKACKAPSACSGKAQTVRGNYGFCRVAFGNRRDQCLVARPSPHGVRPSSPTTARVDCQTAIHRPHVKALWNPGCTRFRRSCRAAHRLGALRWRDSTQVCCWRARLLLPGSGSSAVAPCVARQRSHRRASVR